MVTTEQRLILEVRTVTGFGGGPDKSILNSPKYLNEFGYQTLVVFLYPPEDPGIRTLLSRAQEAGVEAIAIPDRGPLDRRSFGELIKICKTRKPAIWHSHEDKGNVWGLFAKRRCPWIKLVSTAHGWWADMGVNPWKSKFYVYCSKVALRRYDHCMAVSDDLYRLFGHWGIPNSKTSLIENAIETDRFARSLSRREAKSQLGLPSDSILFGGLGRLAKEKNFAAMIRTVVRLKDRVPKIHLVIGGEGAERRELEACIAEHGAQEYVTLAGYLEDPRLMLQALDVFVLNSLTEGMPNVVLEAMAMETAVVCTRVAEVPRMIEDHRQGLLVDIANDSQLESAMLETAISSELRESLGRAGRERVLERYDFRSRVQKVAQVYDAILFGSKNMIA